MTGPLNRLELAGWSVFAAEGLQITLSDATALRELVMRPGRLVEYDRLDKCFHSQERPKHPRGPASRRLPTYMARLRNALEDVGVPRQAIQNEPGMGYAIPEQHARRVREIVEGL